MKAGANLGGSDIEGGFASLIANKAVRAQDERALRIWMKAGVPLAQSKLELN